jgi:hypothetical protein
MPSRDGVRPTTESDVNMPIYRLDPIDLEHFDWRASELPPRPIWVNAPTEGDARQLAQMASVKAMNVMPGEKIHAC